MSSPLLLINGTLVQSGKRIITSPVQVTANIFHEAHDFYRFLGDKNVRLSTAVHNGARFTYVSPAGTLRIKSRENDRLLPTGQIIDGGYFENYGADTASEFLLALCKFLNCTKESALVHPMVIQISSDPELRDLVQGIDSGPSADGLDWLKHRSQTFAPLAGFQNTRGARGINAVNRLQRLIRDYGGTFIHLRLCELHGREKPPLGWLLSEQAKKTIDDHWERPCKGPVAYSNVEQIATLKKAFARAQSEKGGDLEP